MTDKLIIAPGTDHNQYYATKLGLHSPFITLCRGKKRFLAAGGFEYPQAAALYPTTRFEELGKDWKSVIKAFCKKYKIKNPEIPSTTYAAFYKAIPKATLTRNMFAERAVKTTQEIKHIKEAQHATDQAILAVREVLQNSVVKNKKIFSVRSVIKKTQCFQVH